MGDYFSLDAKSQAEMLLVASADTGRAAALLEKDIWVVRTLGWLSGTPWGRHLVFKGGTSLSKVHGLIDRFSEDIDLTYDIRELIPGLRNAVADPLPDTRAQADRWTRQARDALAAWVADEVAPALRRHLEGQAVSVREDGADIYVEYVSALQASPGYLRSGVKLEFGGRATGEPADAARVVCDAAACHGLGEYLPTATVQAMRSERTFWEKATAAHVFCLQEKLPAERFARHWFDLACMSNKGVAARALEDHELARKVADYKAMFFRMKASDDSAVDYLAAVTGKLQLVPAPDTAARLREDYDAMLDGGFLGQWQPAFDEVLGVCERIQAQANARADHA